MLEASDATGPVFFLSLISWGVFAPILPSSLAKETQSAHQDPIVSQGAHFASVERPTAAPEYQTTESAPQPFLKRRSSPLLPLFELVREALGTTRLRFTRPSEIARLNS